MPEGSLAQRSQQAMIDFLRLDTDLAFTFLDIAVTEAHSDPPHSACAIEKSRTALETIRKLAVRIEDRAVRAAIETRANELEAAIVKLSH